MTDKEIENPEFELVEDNYVQGQQAVSKNMSPIIIKDIPNHGVGLKDYKYTQSDIQDSLHQKYQTNRSNQDNNKIIGPSDTQIERIIFPKQLSLFVGEDGSPISVQISKNITWKPLDVICDFDQCSNIAYNRCSSNLHNLGFPSFTIKWTGCSKFHCIVHSYFRPLIHSKPVYRCRDSECNYRFYETLHQWQDARCTFWSILTLIIILVIESVIYSIQISQDHTYNPTWYIIMCIFFIFSVPCWIRKRLSQPYESRPQGDDGMGQLIINVPGNYDFDCQQDGQDLAHNYSIDFGAFEEVSKDSQRNMLEIMEREQRVESNEQREQGDQ